jgi:hypothetical protein
VLGVEDGPTGFACNDRIWGVFTPRESEVLLKIRDASRRAREVKAVLRRRETTPEASDPGNGEAARELENLRELRRGLERDRLAARGERMHILGHE